MRDEHYQEFGRSKAPAFQWQDILVLLLLAASVYITFYKVRAGYFIADDYLLLYQAKFHASVKNLVTWSWGPDGMGHALYRPLTVFNWWLNYWISGLAAKGFFTINLWLHIINGYLAYWLMLFVARQRLASLAAALLFAVHPMQAEVLGWLSGRSELLLTSFYLLAALFLIIAQQRDRPSAILRLASVGCFAAALLSHELAVTFPLIALLLISSAINDRPRTISDYSALLPCLLVLVAHGILRYMMVGKVASVHLFAADSASNASALANFKALLGWFALPFGFTNYKGFEIGLILAVLLAAFLLLTMFRYYRFGVLWLILTLTPFIFTGQPRVLYLPSIGFFFILGMLLARRRPVVRSSIMAGLVLAGSLMFYVTESRKQSQAWVQAGVVAHGLETMLKNLYPAFPQGSELWFDNPPVDTQLGLGIFQVGLQEAIHLWYDDPTIAVHGPPLASRQLIKNELTHWFRFEGERFAEVSKLVDSASGNLQRLGPADGKVELSCWKLRHLIELPEPADADELEIWSAMTNGLELEQGATVAQLSIEAADGTIIHVPLKAGIDTAEKSYDRPSVRQRVHQQRPQIAFSWFGHEADGELFPIHAYRTRASFPNTVSVVNIAIEFKCLPETNMNGTSLEITDIFAVTQEGDDSDANPVNTVNPS